MPQSYTTGGDTWANIKFLDVSGQNFHPQSTFILEWVDLWLDRALPFTQPAVEIFYCGGDHKPFGDSLSRNRFVIASEALPGGIYHVRFSMQPLKLTEGEYYCLQVRWSPPIPFPTLQWRYDAGDATYPRGMRISSDDSGATWTIHYNDDHMFALWGTPPVPPPPPEPPINNVAILDLAQLITADGMQLTLTTNVPCHLYAAYTLNTPLKHPVPREQRGIALPDDTRWCFVDWTLNEQEEEGDTIYHTFTKEPWPVCETRYFCFRAKVDGEWVPAASPIFTIHRIPAPITAYFYPDAHPETTSVDGRVRRQCPTYCFWDDIRNGPGVLAYDAVAGAFIQISAAGYANYWFSIDRGIILFDTSTIPLPATILSAQLRLYAVGKGDGLNIHDTFAANLYSSNPASNIALIPADYSATGIIPYSNPVLWDDWAAGAHSTFDFLPAALSAIIKGGITKLALREAAYDVPDSPPTWIRNASTSMAFGTAENGGDQRPRLKVVYL